MSTPVEALQADAVPTQMATYSEQFWSATTPETVSIVPALQALARVVELGIQENKQ